MMEGEISTFLFSQEKALRASTNLLGKFGAEKYVA